MSSVASFSVAAPAVSYSTVFRFVRHVSPVRSASIAASSMDEALAEFTRFAPHLVLSDIGMPGHDGYELIVRLRAARRARRPSGRADRPCAQRRPHPRPARRLSNACGQARRCRRTRRGVSKSSRATVARLLSCPRRARTICRNRRGSEAVMAEPRLAISAPEVLVAAGRLGVARPKASSASTEDLGRRVLPQRRQKRAARSDSTEHEVWSRV